MKLLDFVWLGVSLILRCEKEGNTSRDCWRVSYRDQIYSINFTAYEGEETAMADSAKCKLEFGFVPEKLEKRNASYFVINKYRPDIKKVNMFVTAGSKLKPSSEVWAYFVTDETIYRLGYARRKGNPRGGMYLDLVTNQGRVEEHGFAAMPLWFKGTSRVRIAWSSIDGKTNIGFYQFRDAWKSYMKLFPPDPLKGRFQYVYFTFKNVEEERLNLC